MLLCLRFPTAVLSSILGRCRGRGVGSPLPLVTNTEGVCAAAKSKRCCSVATACCLRDAPALLFVLGCGEGVVWALETEAEGSSKACWEDEGGMLVAVEVLLEVEARAALPSLAKATGISSSDSAESE